MTTIINLSDIDYNPPKRQTVKGVNTVNPLYDINCLPESFLELYNNLEVYYAPKKICTFENMTRNEVKNHLLSIFGDDDFCNVYAGVLKRDYTGIDRVMTPKEAKNYLKKRLKKC
jgi:hypothetical protein